MLRPQMIAKYEPISSRPRYTVGSAGGWSRSTMVRTASWAYQALTASASRDSMAALRSVRSVLIAVMAGSLSRAVLGVLGSRFEDEVHRRLAGDADAGEAGLREQVREDSWTGLRSERLRPRLGQRGRRADQGRAAVEDSADGIEVLLQPVVGEWFDQQQGAVLVQRPPDRAGHRDGVAHVVQTVEHGDEVVGVWCQFGGVCHLEAHPVADAGLLGSPPRHAYGPFVIVSADERRGREGLRHQDRGRGVPAADVGHAGPRGQLLHHAVQG